MLSFVWDEEKNKINVLKHAVSFQEAQTVFEDENALFIFDPDHSDNEDRFILMGVSRELRLLVVCHCYREEGEQVRIISARKATKKETCEKGDEERNEFLQGEKLCVKNMIFQKLLRIRIRIKPRD